MSRKKSLDQFNHYWKPVPITADESFHASAELEWWFVQGYYEGKNTYRKYFMVSIFKHDVSLTKDSKQNAFSFLLSILNPQTGKQDASSRIDRSLLNSAIVNKDQIRGINIDHHIIDAFINEISDFGPPRNIDLSETEVNLQADPFKIKWDDLILMQSTNQFNLSFNEINTNLSCKFQLFPEKDFISLPRVQNLGKSEAGMNYHSYPRLHLTGKVNGDEVNGEAWLDHQWGDKCWIISDNKPKRIRGWDWFGINLDDGSDLIIIVNKDVQTNTALAKQAVYRNDNNEIQIANDIILKPLRTWESNKTYIHHPISWQIILPESDIELTFTPLADDQEIPVFGLIRTIWEGAGEVSGTVCGKSVTGRARGEFYGYSYIIDFKEYLKSVASRVDRHIESFLPRIIEEINLNEYMGPASWNYHTSAYTEILSRPVWDLISRGGKRWRPVFALLLLDALGGNADLFEPMICALAELPHTGSLIIDDIQDASIKRRGEESLHIRYGEDVAIGAANTLYFLPTILIFNNPYLDKKQKREIHEEMMRQNIRAHFGQNLDVYWSRNMDNAHLKDWMNDSLAPKILQMYALKTAAPIEGLAISAAIVANTDNKTKETCVELARALGVAFQIIDDIHCFSKSSEWKKECGEDIAEGKLSYVIFRALEKLKDQGCKRLHNILCSKQLRKDPENIKEAVELVRQSGVLQLCREEAHSMIEPQWEKISKMLQPSESKILLHALYESLIDMNYDK